VPTLAELSDWERRFAAAGLLYTRVAPANSIAGAAVVVFRDPDTSSSSQDDAGTRPRARRFRLSQEIRWPCHDSASKVGNAEFVATPASSAATRSHVAQPTSGLCTSSSRTAVPHSYQSRRTRWRPRRPDVSIPDGRVVSELRPMTLSGQSPSIKPSSHMSTYGLPNAADQKGWGSRLRLSDGD